MCLCGGCAWNCAHASVSASVRVRVGIWIVAPVCTRVGVRTSLTWPLVDLIQATPWFLRFCLPQAEETDSQACSPKMFAESHRLFISMGSLLGLVLSNTHG